MWAALCRVVVAHTGLVVHANPALGTHTTSGNTTCKAGRQAGGHNQKTEAQNIMPARTCRSHTRRVRPVTSHVKCEKA